MTPADCVKGHDGRSLIHGIEDRTGQVAVLWPWHGHHAGAGFARGLAPRIHVRRELLGKRDDGLTFPQRQIPGGHRDAVARGRDDGDVVLCSVNERREQATGDLRVRIKILAADLPGLGFSAACPLACRYDGIGQGPEVRAIQVRDILGDVEQMSLARYHRVVPWRKDASCSPGGGTINSIDLDGWPDK
jgi:hypothetical protein